MSNSNEWQARFDELAFALSAGDLSEEMSDELAVMLAKHPDASPRLAQHQQMVALLSEGVLDVAELPTRRTRPWRGSIYAATALALLACVAFVWQTAFVPGSNAVESIVQNDGTISSDEPVDAGVAVITQTIQARWKSTRDFDVGTSLSPGSFDLNSGVVQLEFYRGAVVVVEGPARFKLLNTERMVCEHGRLRARVPPQADGFTVETARFELVDRGTEFGLNMAADGTAQVDVFEGRVDLFDVDSNRSPASRRQVNAAESVAVARDGKTTLDVEQMLQYVSTDDVRNLARSQSAERYTAWQSASKAIASDPDVVAWFDFAREPSADRTLTIAGAPQDGAIIGSNWTTGRWPQKQALEFKRPSDRVRCSIGGEYESITLSAWVRIDGLDRPFSALLLTNGYEEGEPHWQLRRDGRLLLGIKNPRGHVAYDSEPILDIHHLGQWTHLTTVYDGPNRLVTHYINGRPAGSQPVSTPPFALRFGDVEIGNWGAPMTYSPQKIRNFNGRIDELTIYRIPQSAEEVLAVFNMGRP